MKRRSRGLLLLPLRPAAPGSHEAPLKAACILARSVPEWEVGSPSDLTFRAKRQVAALKGVGQLRPADLKALGLTQSPANDALKTLVTASARLLTSGALGTPAGKQSQALIVEAANGADPALAKAIAGAGGDKSRFSFDGDTRNKITSAVVLLMPFLDDAIAMLEGPLTGPAEARLRKYFPPLVDRPLDGRGDIRKIAKAVQRNLMKAREILQIPFDDLFKAVARGINIDPELRDEFLADPDLIAVEAGRTIFINQVRINAVAQNPLQFARIILHEAMHAALTRGNEDAVYLEQGVDGLDINSAINNADSHVAFVLHDRIEAAKVFKFRFR